MTLLHAREGISERGPDLLPLNAGEQYRFTFSMEACIGCHSCEVACGEQNGNPAGVNWRRVGELEAGTFPTTRRLTISMACNHCLEPSCLSGCPTNAYTKLTNGVVKHDADRCIGCQYCTWNCPYEVPVFNRDRGIVTKCDMCLPRLEAGRSPACVEACPTRAIGVEKVDVTAWRADHSKADAPGLPPSGLTISTTRVELPADVPASTMRAGDQRVRPEEPHWPLIGLTMLTQMAVGAVVATVVAELLVGHGRNDALAGGAAAAFAGGVLALVVSVLHLGRPVFAWKALANVAHSWLSREVLLFGLFAAAAMAYTLAWRLHGPTLAVGATAAALGIAGVYASARLYVVPARPVWNSSRTPVAFFATAVATGPLVVLLTVGDALDRGGVALLLAVSAAGTAAQLLVYRNLIERVTSRGEREYRGTARLLLSHFRRLFVARIALALVGCTCAGVTIAVPAAPIVAVTLAATAVGELIGRYLFYVTVTPMSSAGSFFAGHPR